MTPRRIAIVGTAPSGGSATDSATVAVTLSRAPWEAEVTLPDPRDETRPGLASIRNPLLDETRGNMAPARRVRR